MRLHTLRALVGAALALCVVMLAALPAWAANKSLVVYVEGPDASAARERVLAVVPKNLDVVDPDKFSKALGDAGQKGQMGITIWLPKKRDKQLKAVRDALEKVGADAAIVARTRKGKGGVPELYVLYVDPIPGDLAVDEAVSMKGSDEDKAAAIKASVGDALAQLAPEEAPEEKAEAKPEEEEKKADNEGKDEADEPDEPSDRKKNDFSRNIFAIGLGFELGGRSFKYSDPVTQNLRPYSVFGVPTLVIDGEVYPAAGTKMTFVRDLGIVAMYGHGLGLSSQTEEEPPRKFGTSYNKFAAGLRYRIRFADENAAVIGISARFGFVNYTFEPKGDDATQQAASDAIKGEVASSSYTYLRPALDARIPIGPVALLPTFGYLAVLSAGDAGRDVYDRFTEEQEGNGVGADASVGGVDFGLGFGIRLMDGLEARLVGEYARFFYSFTPQVGDTYVAGGALDQIYAVRLGAVYAY
jgi:hypothetical protein